MGERTAAEQARHTDELAQLHQQVQLFVEHFTAQVQSSLAVVHLPATSTSSSSSSHPTVVSLDGILPPPPQPKSKRKASSAAPSTTTSSLSSLPPSSPSVDAECDNSDEGEEVERDAFGRSIKRRRSKLPLKAVLVLRAWFSQHLTFPYPSEQEKEQLATAAHLQPRQVQNCQPQQPQLLPLAGGLTLLIHRCLADRCVSCLCAVQG